MGGYFAGLVEGIRYLGWAAVGIHFVHSYVTILVGVMFVAQVAALFLAGPLQRGLRWTALLTGCLVGAVHLVLCLINPTFRYGLILLYSAYTVVRTGLLLKSNKNR
jgi:hypothetical protein